MADSIEMFAVAPKTNCPHLTLDNVNVEDYQVDVHHPCNSCGDKSENWLCLKCNTISCSRFVNAHASAHYEETGHGIALSFSDLSFWCYKCDSYIKSPALNQVYRACYLSKFNEEPPQTTNRGIGVDEDIREFYDSPEVLASKVKSLAELIKGSRFAVAYTGAGVSTSAKLMDYRGPKGFWTLKDKGEHAQSQIRIDQAMPTLTHVGLVLLQRNNLLKFLVSTNVDGLHRKAGTTVDEMSELHGNCYRETCEFCSKEYLREYDVTGDGTIQHFTFRHCDNGECKGRLRDTIINFGENLPENELAKAYSAAKSSDLSIVMGTSMRVTPACEIPLIPVEKRRGDLVICNLQKTPYDDQAALRIWAPTDVVMNMLLRELNIPIPTETPQGFPVPGVEPYTPDPSDAPQQGRPKRRKM